MIPEIELVGTNMTKVITDHGTYFYSYITCVAYANTRTGCRIRREGTISATTSKHLGKFGCKEWKQVTIEEFNSTIREQATNV